MINIDERRKTLMASALEGTFVTSEALDRQAYALSQCSGEAYQQEVILPAESNERFSIIKLIEAISQQIIQQEEDGSMYLAEMDMLDGDITRRVGVVAQNRRVNNGVWSPSQHRQAVNWVRQMEQKHLPIVTFIDTPGADAGANANLQNQAHSISYLIATMADLKVPTLGIVWGIGYSGGAIPLASTNLLLSVRDGLFSTIQPKGLASIARKQKLDWQTCARLVGVSASELYFEGVIDAVINYSPLKNSDQTKPICQAILHSLEMIERESERFVRERDEIITMVDEEIRQFTTGDVDKRRKLTPFNVTGFPSVFGFAQNRMRGELLASRLKTQSVEWKETEEASTELPVSPEHQQRILSDNRFKDWLSKSGKLIYEDVLLKNWQKFKESEAHIEDDRGYLASLFLGDPKENHDKAYTELAANLAFYLYNSWQQEAPHHLNALIEKLETDRDESTCNGVSDDQLHVIDLIQDSRFKKVMIDYCQHLIQFDLLYEILLDNMTHIVSELSESKKVSGTLLHSMLLKVGIEEGAKNSSFSRWLLQLRKTSEFSNHLRSAEQWKKNQHSRQSDVVFVVVSHFFNILYPELFESKKSLEQFSESFNPVSIGRRKNFWHRLNQAIQDLRIQAVINDSKPSSHFAPKELLNLLFKDFQELNNNVTSANPKKFPGFGDAILRQQAKNKPTSGLITGVAKFLQADQEESVGVLVSNHAFQAGAFDMSAAERFCRLLDYCTEHKLPVIGFISSGGMQTKEGASALFSMAVVNDRINRFVMDQGLPILLFGYGDCTGGAQASFVTHPLVDTWYFSGTNMPFAGRIVVPEYLPVTATLSNYLANVSGSMKGLVQNPFVNHLDEQLKAIDSQIPVATMQVAECIQYWLNKNEPSKLGIGIENHKQDNKSRRFEAYNKVLIHARGCTAVKLIREAHKLDLNLVLVQSDPDMSSVPAEMLRETDSLVCLGGFTADESYLNADSVLHIADMNGVEALHPGIGFLSENSQFAQQCLNHGLIFIGPSPGSMNAMGDKAQAINTAIKLDVPVVPGSHAVLKDIHHARQIAQDIGFPIILKAAHGGGGKGICVVENKDVLDSRFYQIKTEAKSSFGSDEIYLERLVTHFQHIEIQLLRDRFGCTKILGLRDCSIQRNKQKIIEESISTVLPDYQQSIAEEASLKLADACDYQGAGTVEFIYDLDRDALYFMEMNTRLQVEHPVTEAVSGINIVQQQFHIAMGKSIENIQIDPKGYAIEVRINAELVCMDRGKLSVIPAPGKVTECVIPEQENISSIVAVAEGKSIPPFYDNLIAQIIAYGDSREEVVAAMSDYLSKVSIKGVETNIKLLQIILSDPTFLSGVYSTNYLPELFAKGSDALDALNNASPNLINQGAGSFNVQVSGSDELKVFAPSTGIIYHSPAPDQPCFLNEGDRVTVNQTLCLLEAMKMFQPISLASFNQKKNEIYPADKQYMINHIKGVDGQQVNKGDLLFVIQPVKEKLKA
jgi:acetyl/propionyl-CoA carboxylase alpha subunit/acetyl-CoA carboxylase beta subunit